MIFQQYYLSCLSHASYLIGDETTGRAVVVDPQRDVSGYVNDAAAQGLTIERVIETHVHADFLSGHLELADHVGAAISYGERADVAFPIEPLGDGQHVVLGDVRLEILATPGHTPESISIVVFEHAADEVPYGVLTGDALFIGDVGRPDLLAASGTGLTADAMARQLYRSLHDKLLALPDETRVFPAHGAGSSCGKNLSSETQSTIGEQRAHNYALAPMTEDEFVSTVIEGQPVKPHYFEFDAHRNRELRPLLAEETEPIAMDIDDVISGQRQGAVLLDTREPNDFAAGHLKGAINVGLQGRFAEYVGDVLTHDQQVVLVGDPSTALEAKVRLARIGFDDVIGQLADPWQVVADRSELIEPSSRLTIAQLAERMVDVPDLAIIDVRGPGETANGTLAGALEVPLPILVDVLDVLKPERPTVVYCAAGSRSSIAASVLRSAGFDDVSDLIGGYTAWAAAGLPVTAHGTHSDDSVRQAGPAAAKAMIDAGAFVLDVREPDEFEAGHISDSTLVPMGQVMDRLDELPNDRRVVVVCRVGGRSAAITEALNARGIDAVNLAGGVRGWVSAGLAIVDHEGSPGAVI